MRRLAWLTLLLAGCYHPTFDDGAFQCGPANSCPPGLECGSDQICHSPGAGARPFVGDGKLGALDLTGRTGVVLVNTETGEITAGADVLRPAGMPGFANVSQGTNAPHAGIFSFSTLTIPSGVTLRPDSASNSVLALAATGKLEVAGKIDWSGFGVSLGGSPGMAGDDSIQSVGGGGAAAAGGGGGRGGGGGCPPGGRGTPP